MNISFGQKFYETYDDAYRDAKKADIVGFVYFPQEFSKTKTLSSFDRIENEDTDEGSLQVFLDNTNGQVSSLIKKELYDTFQRFTRQIMKDCGQSNKNVGELIIFEVLCGEKKFNMKITISVGMVLG